MTSTEFRSLLARDGPGTYPAHEHERFLAHFRGLIDAWIRDNNT